MPKMQPEMAANEMQFKFRLKCCTAFTQNTLKHMNTQMWSKNVPASVQQSAFSTAVLAFGQYPHFWLLDKTDYSLSYFNTNQKRKVKRIPGFCLLKVGCISFTYVMYAVRGLLGGPPVEVLKLFNTGATHEHLQLQSNVTVPNNPWMLKYFLNFVKTTPSYTLKMFNNNFSYWASAALSCKIHKLIICMAVKLWSY